MKGLSLTLMSNPRLAMEFFMYLPHVKQNGEYYSVDVSPCLFLKKKSTLQQSIPGERQKLVQYKITPKNIVDVISTINSAVKWFYREDMKDMYGYNDNNELVFNLNYNKLSVRTRPSKNDGSFLQILPTLVKENDGVGEGVVIIINSIDNSFYLYREELEAVLALLSKFSFYDTASFAMTALKTAIDMNTVDDGRPKMMNDKYTFNGKKNIWEKEKKDIRAT